MQTGQILFVSKVDRGERDRYTDEQLSAPIYICYLLVSAPSSLQDGLDGPEVCSWCRSSLSQRPLLTRYCHPRSSASAICSDRHSTGSTRPDCNSTTKFRSQRTSHQDYGHQIWLKTHLFSTVRRHWDVFIDSGTGYQYPDLLTYLLTYLLPSHRLHYSIRLMRRTP